MFMYVSLYALEILPNIISCCNAGRCSSKKITEKNFPKLFRHCIVSIRNCGWTLNTPFRDFINPITRNRCNPKPISFSYHSVTMARNRYVANAT